MPESTPFDFIRDATRRHRSEHGCWAYAFEDGPGLISLARRLDPARVLELGTALGFTACCLASVSEATRVDTIEGDPEHAALARVNIRRANLDNQITVYEGDFQAAFKRLTGPYDLVFFDGFSPDRSIIRCVRALLEEGGVLACANLPYVSDRDARLLSAELSNPMRWAPTGEIEGGATRLFRKVGCS